LEGTKPITTSQQAKDVLAKYAENLFGRSCTGPEIDSTGAVLLAQHRENSAELLQIVARLRLALASFGFGGV